MDRTQALIVRAQQGDKAASEQLVLENAPQDEFKQVLDFCREVGLPTNLAALGLTDVSDGDLMKAARAACAEGETIHNMPFKVTPEAVFSAMRVADRLGS